MYLEEGDKHFVSHLRCPSFDVALHQHIVQSRIECLIWLILLGLVAFDSPYFDVVESYTLFFFLFIIHVS
jgi:hypothetical protein